LAKQLGLSPEQLTFLATLRGAGSRPKRLIPTRFHYHKELFYLGAYLRAAGREQGAIIDQFRPDWHGPTSVHLIPLTNRLEEMGLVGIESYPSRSEPGNAGFRYTLSPKGVEMAEKIVRNLPTFFKEAMVRVDSEVHPLSLRKLEDKVHSEFPEFWLGL